MASLQFTLTVLLCLPFALMLLAMLASRRTTIGTAALWRYFTWLSALGLASTVLAGAMAMSAAPVWAQTTPQTPSTLPGVTVTLISVP